VRVEVGGGGVTRKVGLRRVLQVRELGEEEGE
jgi:hypothetical protein